MFTIKHIDDYGNEALFNAASVRVLRGSEEPDGVKIEGIVDQDHSGVHYSFRDPREVRDANGYEAAIYVMNESGATVAKYLL